jgi:hypothetical protein
MLRFVRKRYITVLVSRDARREGGKRVVRVLVSVAPRSYREAVALTLQKHRPHLEVRLAAPEDLNLEAERFEPDLVVCNEVTALVQANVPSWVRILFEDGLDAIVCVEGQTSEVHDISTDNLLETVDETEKIVSQG